VLSEAVLVLVIDVTKLGTDPAQLGFRNACLIGKQGAHPALMGTVVQVRSNSDCCMSPDMQRRSGVIKKLK
jgi:hypothetical protein